MVLVSATRFRIRSPLYLPLVFWHTLWSSRQLTRTVGFKGGRILQEGDWAFWTVTAWQDTAFMRRYRDTDAHRRAMPWLSMMCNEAVSGHWQQEETTLPDWQTIHHHLMERGRLYHLSNPSKAHADRLIPPPKVSSPFAGSMVLPK